MKRTLLSFLMAILTAAGVSAQEWEWGTAKWNIEDGAVFYDIVNFNEKGGLSLSYPNPTNYYLTFFNMLAVSYNVYVDDATEPIEYTSSVQGRNMDGSDTADEDGNYPIHFSFGFSEGHKYRIVTTGTVLAQANLATYSTDTLSLNTDSYSISFTIQGPELVKTIDVEAIMSLAITDQAADPTISEVDTVAIKEALGISALSEAAVYGLNLDGSYIEYEWYAEYFDGWKDADGDYTNYNGGYDSYHGHNAYPAVYCIKMNATADTISYFFYDWWKEYNPDEGTELPGADVDGNVKAKAPATSYNSTIWDWEDEDGTVYQYTRYYRCDEGKDYKSSFIYKANNKYVLLNATLHFLSIEDYNAVGIKDVATPATPPAIEGIYSLSGVRLNSLQKGINIVKSADGSTRKVLVK